MHYAIINNITFNKNKMTTNNQVIDNFIIEAILIEPISKIINQLKNGEFRDCDIKWLDTKLEHFIKLACETLDIKTMMLSDVNSEKQTILNNYVLTQYLNRFNTLLDYFKTI